MKTKQNTIIALLITTISIICLTACMGCKTTLAPGGVYNGDTVLYNAELVTVSADATFKAFISWEQANRDTLAKYPDIRNAADYLAANNRAWLITAVQAIEVYKQAPIPKNLETLSKALDVLTQEMKKTTELLAKGTQ